MPPPPTSQPAPAPPRPQAQVFRKYDADGSGELDKDELVAALTELGVLDGLEAKRAGEWSAAAFSLPHLSSRARQLLVWQGRRHNTARLWGQEELLWPVLAARRPGAGPADAGGGHQR